MKGHMKSGKMSGGGAGSRRNAPKPSRNYDPSLPKPRSAEMATRHNSSSVKGVRRGA